MDLNELEAKLMALESRNAQQDALAEQQGFIDKYGTMFSGDEGIGMAILAEMSRRGIGAATVGADRVVQEILDAIRQEASSVLDKIKMDRDTVNNLVAQVQDIQDSVASATGGAPGDAMLEMPPAVPPIDVPPDIGAGVPPPAAGEAPLDVPPPEAAAPTDVPLPAETPPVEEAPLPPPPPVPSDKRLKLVKKIAPAAVTVPSDNRIKNWKPASHILGAIKGGI